MAMRQGHAYLTIFVTYKLMFFLDLILLENYNLSKTEEPCLIKDISDDDNCCVIGDKQLDSR